MTVENNTGSAAPAVSTPAPKSEISAPAPAADTAISAPATNPTPIAEPTALPAAEALASAPAVVDAPAAAEPVLAASAKTTILGSEPPKAATALAPENKDVKPAGESVAEPKKDEGSQSVEPAPLPTYESFKLADGIQIDERKLGEFTKELGEFEIGTKAEHGKVQEFAQKLVNRYVSETQETVKRIVDHYTNTWDKQKNDWREAFISDPELGGNRQQTTATSVQNFVGEFGGDAKQIEELRGFMESGIGNHPSLIRLMNNANNEVKALRMKYESEEGVRPLPGHKPVSEKKSKTQTLYGKSSASA